jgi:hypothetical protein
VGVGWEALKLEAKEERVAGDKRWAASKGEVDGSDVVSTVVAKAVRRAKIRAWR